MFWVPVRTQRTTVLSSFHNCFVIISWPFFIMSDTQAHPAPRYPTAVNQLLVHLQSVPNAAPFDDCFVSSAFCVPYPTVGTQSMTKAWPIYWIDLTWFCFARQLWMWHNVVFWVRWSVLILSLFGHTCGTDWFPTGHIFRWHTLVSDVSYPTHLIGCRCASCAERSRRLAPTEQHL